MAREDPERDRRQILNDPAERLTRSLIIAGTGTAATISSWALPGQRAAGRSDRRKARSARGATALGKKYACRAVVGLQSAA
jgi:hypothetical protein